MLPVHRRGIGGGLLLTKLVFHRWHQARFPPAPPHSTRILSTHPHQVRFPPAPPHGTQNLPAASAPSSISAGPVRKSLREEALARNGLREAVGHSPSAILSNFPAPSPRLAESALTSGDSRQPRRTEPDFHRRHPHEARILPTHPHQARFLPSRRESLLVRRPLARIPLGASSAASPNPNPAGSSRIRLDGVAFGENPAQCGGLWRETCLVWRSQLFSGLVRRPLSGIALGAVPAASPNPNPAGCHDFGLSENGLGEMQSHRGRQRSQLVFCCYSVCHSALSVMAQRHATSKLFSPFVER